MAKEIKEILYLLEDTGTLLKKAITNFKKCSKARLTQSYLETRLSMLQEYWVTFKNAHQDLVKSVPKEEKVNMPYFINEEYYTHEEIYLEMQADIKELLRNLEKSPEKSLQKNVSINNESLVKLPRIQMPTFSGIYEEWPAFQDMYETLVHGNQALNKVQKLHYLKTSLTGEAESLLKHVQVTKYNYDQSWIMLKARYGNKRVIVNSLLKRLFMQRKIATQSPSSLKLLLDTTTECLNSLKNQNLSIDSWDPLIIFLTVQKMDPETHRDWEEFAYKEDCEELPKWSDLSKFLQSKFRTLELITPAKERATKSREYAVHVSTTSAERARSCILCKEDHTLSHCREFSKMTPTERGEYIKNAQLCFNCLAPGHLARRCRLTMSCRLCHRRHHTLVHQTTTMTSPKQPDNIQGHHSQVEDLEEPTAGSNVDIVTNFVSNQSTALLATALVPIKDEYDHTTLVRALIDHGSQATFITERAAQSLRLKKTSFNGTVTGVGSTKTRIKHAAEVTLLSRQDPSFNFKTKVYVMPTQLTSQLPSTTIYTNTWPHIQGLTLADPRFDKPGRVDMLLGVDVCSQIMKSEIIRGPPGSPCAQNTSLGWILFGAIQRETKIDEIKVMHVHLDLDDMLKRMWEHEVDKKGKYTAQERKCEELYQETTSRTEDGRYIVKLPTKNNLLLSTYGESRNIAVKRLYQLERRLEKNLILKKEYVNVMQEYKELNHMKLIPEEDINKPAVYLPHHAVIKNEKETTKLRVVFNASQKGSNNVSLNDELLVGPQLQEDIRSLIMRWRMKKICFVADIQKMYRQILVKNEDQDLQRILWRDNVNEPIKDYKLLRLTFGTASAPYLAVKTLHQIAEDEGEINLEAARILKEDCFMDDVMSGNDSLEEAIKNAKDLQAMLQKGGFILQKWCSNESQFLKQFKAEERSSRVNLNIKLDGMVRALGLHWNMGKDMFQYSQNLSQINKVISKRTILSDIQKLFDPLGWLAPSILQAKMFIQSLWLQKITWDEEVEESIAEKWIELKENFKYLPNIELNRWLQTTEKEISNATVHGFCDASTKAYAAVAYMRIRTETGKVKTTIIAARTRVAPIKPMTLPRLELCGAVLLSKLLKQIKESMRLSINQIFAWTDSTIVLSWLFGDPARWNTFVRNRIVEILDNFGNQNWYHVQSVDNPADVASRGKPLLDLKKDKMWWEGPKWLTEGNIKYTKPENCNTKLERREVIQVNMKIHDKEEKFTGKFKEFDNLIELLKTITYCRRFLKKEEKDKDNIMTTLEMEESLQRCVALAQRDDFPEDIENLKEKKEVKKNSRIKLLKPYLDENQILRVGGRLRHSDLPEEEKHPMVLDFKNPLTELIVVDAHVKTMHGGCQLMLNYLMKRFWILKAKKIVKLKIHRCLTCAKQSAAARSQLMGDLPRVRVTPARAFLNSGVDFAGPYQILMSRGRGAKTSKAYIALFVCMSTKAVHLELVGDLTSEAFIGAFRRFVSRRGRCAHIWSDQGRNFVGANKELAVAFEEARLNFESHIAEMLALDGTQWHHIPAYSPHMGGLWEAGVKSVKHHLKRVLTTNLTYEEMSTILCQIEACLNSRPLSLVADTDPDQIQPLTPGHFLIGEAPITVPTPELKDISVGYLSRWQYLQKLLGDFWVRWQQEYLSKLQQRPKWLKKIPEFDIGHIVLIKCDNLPPGKWILGRITEKHPGTDGITRVYSVKSGSIIVKRSANKLCPLPIDIE